MRAISPGCGVRHARARRPGQDVEVPGERAQRIGVDHHRAAGGRPRARAPAPASRGGARGPDPSATASRARASSRMRPRAACADRARGGLGKRLRHVLHDERRRRWAAGRRGVATVTSPAPVRSAARAASAAAPVLPTRARRRRADARSVPLCASRGPRAGTRGAVRVLEQERATIPRRLACGQRRWGPRPPRPPRSAAGSQQQRALVDRRRSRSARAPCAGRPVAGRPEADPAAPTGGRARSSGHAPTPALIEPGDRRGAEPPRHAAARRCREAHPPTTSAAATARSTASSPASAVISVTRPR